MDQHKNTSFFLKENNGTTRREFITQTSVFTASVALATSSKRKILTALNAAQPGMLTVALNINGKKKTLEYTPTNHDRFDVLNDNYFYWMCKNNQVSYCTTLN